MADNIQPPAAIPDTQRRQPIEASSLQQKVVIFIFLGGILAKLYLEYIIPRFSVLPPDQYTLYPKSDANKYYDVLNISHHANGTEIEQAYAILIRGQIKEGYRVLSSGARCVYDFEILGLGFIRYIKCRLFRGSYP
ncbi:hypothetical protein HD806DRAFT_480514 [Xylariaceae sp. AK1471]|nr:hypothetical protein HD806DRAFT_480514 [Xylariaceae sp. AK1471]